MYRRTKCIILKYGTISADRQYKVDRQYKT